VIVVTTPPRQDLPHGTEWLPAACRPPCDPQRPVGPFAEGTSRPARGNYPDLPARTKYIGQRGGALLGELDIWDKRVVLARVLRLKFANRRNSRLKSHASMRDVQESAVAMKH
jgi:hypothetical protein